MPFGAQLSSVTTMQSPDPLSCHAVVVEDIFVDARTDARHFGHDHEPVIEGLGRRPEQVVAQRIGKGACPPRESVSSDHWVQRMLSGVYPRGASSFLSGFG